MAAEKAYGGRLRQLREEQGIGLRELGRLAGLSPASLSTVERDRSSPTLATLSKILKALGTDLTHFFAHVADDAQQPVITRDSMRSAGGKYRQYTFLLGNRQDIRFQMLDEQIQSRERKGEWEEHDFDVGGVVVEGGPMLLEIDGSGQWTLGVGDAFYIKAGERHRGSNAGRGALRLITVADPPRY